MDQCKKIHDFLTVCAPSPLQEAVIPGLEAPMSYYKELQAHFDSMEWYSPIVEAKDFDESILNEYELYNLKLIGKFEKKAK